MLAPSTLTLGGRAHDITHRGLVVGVAGDDVGAAAELAAEGADLIEVAEALVGRSGSLAVATGRPVVASVSSSDAARAAVEAGAAALRLLADAPDVAAWAADRSIPLIVALDHPAVVEAGGPATLVELGGVSGITAAASLARPGRVLVLDDGTAAVGAGGSAPDEGVRGRLVGLHVAAAVLGVRVARTTQVRTVRRALDVLAAVTSARRARLGP